MNPQDGDCSELPVDIRQNLVRITFRLEEGRPETEREIEHVGGLVVEDIQVQSQNGSPFELGSHSTDNEEFKLRDGAGLAGARGT